MRYAWRTMNSLTNSLFRGIRSVVPPVLIAIAAGAVLYAAGSYGATARQLPMLVAGSVLFLALLDLASRLPGRTGRALRVALGAGFDEPEFDRRPGWRREIVQVGWVAATAVAVVLFGFLVTIPVFVFLYARIHGSGSTLASLAAAAVTVAAVVIVFEILLDYEIYRGVLFGADFHV